MSVEEQKFIEEITQAIVNESIVLPTLPEIALKVREAVDDPNITAQKLGEIISKDPVLSAKIVKVANSPLMRGSVKVDSLNQAVNRLGLKFVRNLATGLAMEHIFQATHPTTDQLLRQVWESSLEVAAISSIIAKNYTNIAPDEAMLAGLVHAIGTLPIVAMAEEHPNLLYNSKELLSIVQKIHPQLGIAILASWDFPDDIANIPNEYRKPKDEQSATLADIVAISKLQCREQSLQEQEMQSQKELYKGCFERIGFNPEDNIYNIEELQEELKQASSSFH